MKLIKGKRSAAVWSLVMMVSVFFAGASWADSNTTTDTGEPVMGQSQRMSRAKAREIRKSLDRAPGWQHSTKSIVGGTNHRYTNDKGMVLELNIPSSGKPQLPGDYLRAGGCGFLQLCVYLNPRDQRALIAGGGAALGIAICAAAPPACPFATVALAVAVSWLRDRGICTGTRDELRVRILPTIGKLGCV